MKTGINQAQITASGNSPPSLASESSLTFSAAGVGVRASSRNVLSADVEIKGSIKFEGELALDGKIEGTIETTGQLIVCENARLKADVTASQIVVYGKVHGCLIASEMVEIKRSAEIVGDIKARNITMEAGAIFVGKSTVGTPARHPSSHNADQLSDMRVPELAIYLPDDVNYVEAEAILVAAGNLMELMGYEYNTEDLGAFHAGSR